MTSANTAPSAQYIVRNDNDGHNIAIETLTEKYFEQARRIENEFNSSTGKGCCFGMFPYSWCPSSKEEFETIYRKNSDRCSTYGLAIRQSDQLVIGVITLRQGGQASKIEEDIFHMPDKNELYINHIAVTKDARGMGAGTKLLEWAEEKARERGATRLLLGVVHKNPAKRLYERFGFVEESVDWCMPACLIGRPHGQFGTCMMEKQMI